MGVGSRALIDELSTPVVEEEGRAEEEEDEEEGDDNGYADSS